MARSSAWRRGLAFDLPRLKHVKNVRSQLKKRCSSSSTTFVSTSSEASTKLLSTLAPEILTLIFNAVAPFGPESDDAVLSEPCYITFIPILAVIRHPLAAVNKDWRGLYLGIALGSKRS